MNDLAIWVFGWDKDAVQAQIDKLSFWQYPHMFTDCDYWLHETQMINRCMRRSESQGFRFMCFADSDVQYDHSQTMEKLYEFISSHEKAGSVRPWRNGDPPLPSGSVEEKYIEDGTGLMFRLNTGIYWDEEFLFTGWSDLDFSNQLERAEYKNYQDRRWPVNHKPSAGHGSSNILQALKKRNKLILDIKWYGVGIENWKGVRAYNESVPVEKQIPTFNQLVTYSNENQDRFSQSIQPEHQQILDKDKDSPRHKHGGRNPNLIWENPVIVGYNTREKFEKEYGAA